MSPLSFESRISLTTIVAALNLALALIGGGAAESARGVSPARCRSRPARTRTRLGRYNGESSAYLPASTWASVASVGRPPVTRWLGDAIEPFAYLKATLTTIASGHPQSQLGDLLRVTARRKADATVGPMNANP